MRSWPCFRDSGPGRRGSCSVQFLGGHLPLPSGTGYVLLSPRGPGPRHPTEVVTSIVHEGDVMGS